MDGISSSALWETYVQHFSFTQLGWIFDSFINKAQEDCLVSYEDVHAIISEWLEHQWGGSFKRIEADDELLKTALTRNPLPLNFVMFIELLKDYQAMHMETEDRAGFPEEAFHVLQDIFDAHATTCPMDTSHGLKGKALFSVLEDLDIQFHSKEERQWYVDTVKRLDKNGDGSVCFSELCQIIRVVVDMELVKKRLREFDLVKMSKLPFDEVEDWNVLFQEKDEEGEGELELVQVKELLTSINMKWDKECSVTITGWITEADENNNGTIDFGEFCLVIGKLWSSNFHDIRGATRKLLKKDVVVALRSVHNFYVTVGPAGELTARAPSVGPSETLVMVRLASGNVNFKGPFGKLFYCKDENIDCNASEKDGTQFKVTTLEDERVVLTASTSFGGCLYALDTGRIAISDGNPINEPHFPFSVVKQEELSKKSWSRMLPKRKPSKMVEKGRAASKQKQASKASSSLADAPAAGESGIQEHIGDIDSHLEVRSRSKRGVA